MAIAQGKPNHDPDQQGLTEDGAQLLEAARGTRADLDAFAALLKRQGGVAPREGDAVEADAGVSVLGRLATVPPR